jgi:hypothetical protein
MLRSLAKASKGACVIAWNEKPEPRMLVVHGTPLVAEDLRETLMSVGVADVQLAPALPDEPPPERFDTCFLSLPSLGTSESGLLERAARIAAHVVLIVGFLQVKPELPPHFSVLSEPFRAEDVLAAMRASKEGGDAMA